MASLKNRVTAIESANGKSAKAATAAADPGPANPRAVESPKIYIPRPREEAVTFPIVGTRPLIVHNWSDKARRMMLDKQMGKTKIGREPKDPVADFNASRYTSTEGWDGIPATAFKAAMVAACRLVDGLTMTLAKQLFFVVGDGFTAKGVDLVRLVGEPTMREDMVRNDSGVADIRFRAQYWPWSAELTIRFNANLINHENIASLVALAGSSVGVCEWRPSAPKVATGSYGLWAIQEG